MTRLFCLTLVVLSVPRGAFAIISGGDVPASLLFLAECKLFANTEEDVKRCITAAGILDPPAIGVERITFSIQTDPRFYIFDPINSGPLGIFSVGGDAPPPDPGVGTRALQLLPDTGFTPGAPLPGSTLTYTDVNGLVTVDYQLASPITASTNVNFFRLDFDFVNPVVINFAESTVTYMASGPGSDFTQVSFACQTVQANGTCGSDTPSTGATFNFSVVPEPSTLELMWIGGLWAMWRLTGSPRRRNLNDAHRGIAALGASQGARGTPGPTVPRA
jgi:hypothetical protein